MASKREAEDVACYPVALAAAVLYMYPCTQTHPHALARTCRRAKEERKWTYKL